MAKNSTNPIKVGTGKSHPPKDMKRKKESHIHSIHALWTNLEYFAIKKGNKLLWV